MATFGMGTTRTQDGKLGMNEGSDEHELAPVGSKKNISHAMKHDFNATLFVFFS